MVTSIHDALKKTRHRLTKNQEWKELAHTIIAEALRVERSTLKLSFKEDTITVKAHPIIKSEMVLKRKEILEKISTLCGKGLVSTLL